MDPDQDLDPDPENPWIWIRIRNNATNNRMYLPEIFPLQNKVQVPYVLTIWAAEKPNHLSWIRLQIGSVGTYGIQQLFGFDLQLTM